ncbi:putative protein tyrosine phosphatase domain-containing protein 1-like [Triplophysa rosa]|uniref:Protein tyrosine phosphatase domain-containing protein 1 n=1 Tax=Triplophysa rosa TaxID=992332 RepID=A0A9W7T4H7_TRIRA|nr:putative protein tyrosine phosphatase domain-containing protein 1-like [Triplophysa rosa]
MARPSTEIIEKYNVIDQFLRCGLKTIINLQYPGEHANCGNPLQPESGFTYRPENFMEAGSVLLACFLLFTTRMTADQAILLVRAKRPNSIQTRRQLQCVRQFAQLLDPLRNVFANAEPRAPPVTLSQYLIRQKHLLHGYEAQRLRFVPKLIPLICKLLLDIAENRQVIEEDIVEVPDVIPLVEKHCNETAVYPFNRQILENGITMIRPRLPGLPRVNADNSQPLHYVRKSLSYSESDLRRLAASLNLSDNPLSVLASIHSCNISNQLAAFSSFSISLETCKDSPGYSSTSNIWDLKTLMDQKEGSTLLKRKRQSVLQRSHSLRVSDQKNITTINKILSFWRKDPNHDGTKQAEVPFITVQSELSLDSRHLLVAHSLAVDLEHDGEKEQIQKVTAWQTDLNYQGAWERLCLEKDPFILSGIMWSWLEQLKEPIISAHDVFVDESIKDPETVLNSLDRVR